MTQAADASVSCYVCGGVADANLQLDLRNPRCVTCEPAASHIISMRTDHMLCACGWSIELSFKQPAERESACKEHWQNIIQEHVPTTERHLPSEVAATSTASEHTSDNFKRHIVTDTTPDPLVAEPVIMLDPSEIDADMPGRIGMFYQAKAEGLAARIDADGQLEPILVFRAGPRAAKRYRLVAGLHRLRACEQLGRHVEARIVTGKPEELLRMQASENLDRRQMTVLERSMFIAAVADASQKRIKELHGDVSPQALGGMAKAARSNLHPAAPVRAVDELAAADEEAVRAVDGLNQTYGWRDEVAEACGLSLDHVKRAMRIYRCVVEPFRDLMDQLKDHPAADNASKLLGVAGVDFSSRRQAILDLIADKPDAAPAPVNDRVFINKFVQLFSRRMKSIDEKKGAIHQLFNDMPERRLLSFSAEVLIEKLGADHVAKMCADRAQGGAE